MAIFNMSGGGIGEYQYVRTDTYGVGDKPSYSGAGVLYVFNDSRKATFVGISNYNGLTVNSELDGMLLAISQDAISSPSCIPFESGITLEILSDTTAGYKCAIAYYKRV